MPTYRITFTRLPRHEGEIISSQIVREVLMAMLPPGRARQAFEKAEKTFPEGHILASMWVHDEEQATGPELLQKHIIPTYPEATLCSWDAVTERTSI